MEEFRHDLRYALRQLRRSPGYAALAVVILGLGIGGVAGAFGLLDAFFLRPLPYPAADRLVQLHRTDPAQGYEGLRFSLPNFLALREEMAARGDQSPVEAMGAYNYGSRNLTAADTEPERLTVARVTVDLLRMLGRSPARGRLFTPGEARLGRGEVLLLDHGVWLRRFGGDPGVVGRTVRLDGRPHTVVGVMPPDFHFPFGGVKAWVPLTEDPTVFGRDYRNFMPVARLREGMDRETAARELSLAYGRAHPLEEDAGRTYGVQAEPLRRALVFLDETLRPAMFAGFGAAGFVLLVVCANLAGLALARARRRERELAVRAVLGAGRGRLVRPLLA